MMTRRDILRGGAALLAGGALSATFRHANAAEKAAAATKPPMPKAPGSHYTPVVTLNGSTLPWKMENGVKVFHLAAGPVTREFAPGMVVNCWGYNGQTPGPTIECVEGDRVRFLVTNKLREHTTIHWHGIFLPNGMDGVGGLNQPHIKPGETYVYEFTLRQNGTFMYHPHADEMVQLAMGMMGLFIVHPKKPENPRIDRDYGILLHNFDVKPGTARRNRSDGGAGRRTGAHPCREPLDARPSHPHSRSRDDGDRHRRRVGASWRALSGGHGKRSGGCGPSPGV